MNERFSQPEREIELAMKPNLLQLHQTKEILCFKIRHASPVYYYESHYDDVSLLYRCGKTVVICLLTSFGIFGSSIIL
jgi:hypothetical protein